MAAGEHAGGKVEEVDEVGGAAPGSLPPNARRRARARALFARRLFLRW